MIEKIEKTFREGKYKIQDGGDGTFFCLEYEPSENEEKKIFKSAQMFFDDVQWCPDPDSHGKQFYAVLNCFYPVERGDGKISSRGTTAPEVNTDDM